MVWGGLLGWKGLPSGSSVKNLPAQEMCWIRKIPWRRKWQPNPVLLPGKSHGQRRLADYRPRSHESWTQMSTMHARIRWGGKQGNWGISWGLLGKGEAQRHPDICCLGKMGFWKVGKDDIEISYKCREPKAHCTQTRASETEPELKGAVKVATFGVFGAETPKSSTACSRCYISVWRRGAR